MQEKRLGFEFAGGGGLLLGAQRGALLDLLREDAARLFAQRQQVVRNFDHLARAFELVVRGLHAKLDLLLDASEILFGLGKLGFVLGDGGVSSATVEKVVAEMEAEGAEILGKKGTLFW